MTWVAQFHISAILTSVVNFLLIYFVFAQPTKGVIAKRFIWYGFSIIFWSVNLFFYSWTSNQQASYIFAQLLHVGAICIPCFFLHFVLEYLNLIEGKQKYVLRFFYLVSTFFLFIDIFYPRLFIADVVPKLGFNYFMNPGIIYHYWMALFFLIVIYTHVLLVRSIFGVKEHLRGQRIFFLAGNSLGYLGGVGIFLPVYNLTMFPFPYGSYGVVLFSFVTFYTILKFRFMEIEVIIKKTLVFAGLFGMFMAVVGLVTVFTQSFLTQFIQVSPVFSTVLIVIFAIILYDPMRNFLVDLTDRYLFQKRFNYRALLKEASQQMAEIKSLKRLTRKIIGFLIKKARITSAAILVRPEVNAKFRLLASRPRIWNNSCSIMDDRHPLLQYFNETQKPIEIVELKDNIKEEKNPEKKRQYETLLSVLEQYHAQAAIPSFLGKFSERPKKGDLELRGVLFIGPQKSDKIFSHEDLDVFYILAQESSVAIENARLFDEAVKRSYELEEINKELLNMNEKLQVTQASLIVAEKSATMVGMAKAIGHEVNNPLATVSGRAHLVLARSFNPFKDLVKKYDNVLSAEDLEKINQSITAGESNAKRIMRSAERINIVVKTLTNILKDTKGEMSPLNMIVLCREAIEAVRFSTYDENLSYSEIDQEIESNLAIMGNLEQLIQVFVNLIKNAHEAMRDQKEKHIVVRGMFDKDNSEMARIEVADNGPGIPPQILAKIWTQGFSTKVKSNDSIGVEGQGQGLFVCKHIIESIHKGSILVKSQNGKGTTFVIKLPLVKEKEID